MSEPSLPAREGTRKTPPPSSTTACVFRTSNASAFYRALHAASRHAASLQSPSLAGVSFCRNHVWSTLDVRSTSTSHFVRHLLPTPASRAHGSSRLVWASSILLLRLAVPRRHGLCPSVVVVLPSIRPSVHFIVIVMPVTLLSTRNNPAMGLQNTAAQTPETSIHGGARS